MFCRVGRGGLFAVRAKGTTQAVLALHHEAPFAVAIDRTLPLARADEAQRLVKSGGLTGRIVVVPT